MKVGEHYKNSDGGRTLSCGSPGAYVPGQLSLLDEGSKFLLDGRERMVTKRIKYFQDTKKTLVKYT